MYCWSNVFACEARSTSHQGSRVGHYGRDLYMTGDTLKLQMKIRVSGFTQRHCYGPRFRRKALAFGSHCVNGRWQTAEAEVAGGIRHGGSAGILWLCQRATTEAFATTAPLGSTTVPADVS